MRLCIDKSGYKVIKKIDTEIAIHINYTLSLCPLSKIPSKKIIIIILPNNINGFYHVVYIQFRQYIFAVVIYRVDANVQIISYFFA